MITKDIQLACQRLSQGHPVAIPTETVYGLAAPIDQEAAIRAVFSLKNRPLNHPLIVHLAPSWDVRQWVAEVPLLAEQFIAAFWPGPLTLVLPAKPGAINPLITGGQDTVAIRCPSHPVAQALLTQLGVPVVAPSANPFGKISPTTAAHVEESFPASDLLILDGGRCEAGIESTLIHVTADNQYQILRHGLINAQQIAEIAHQAALSGESSLRAPGKLDQHYQPEKPLLRFDNPSDLAAFYKAQLRPCYVIASQKPDGLPNTHFYALPNDPTEAAFELYYQIRRADQSDAALLLIEMPNDTPSWAGVRERILKASQKPFDMDKKKS